ncbi:hypothetical protein H2200_009415 [Cladophialophora chaetospira]|uniref:Uncharacterized protein n=1 Tax=Cladophialophora chaetospira TaxID=386627 RepID=A0AA38X425_9EURO|nr:hypothetical protein H2200_009415 [Cladophialophora chaetospira]
MPELNAGTGLRQLKVLRGHMFHWIYHAFLPPSCLRPSCSGRSDEPPEDNIIPALEHNGDPSDAALDHDGNTRPLKHNSDFKHELSEHVDNLKHPERDHNLKLSERDDNLKLPKRDDNLKLPEHDDEPPSGKHDLNILLLCKRGS